MLSGDAVETNSFELKIRGKTISVDTYTLGRFITTRVISDEEGTSLYGMLRSTIKSLLNCNPIAPEEIPLLVDSALLFAENKELRGYLRSKEWDVERAEKEAYNSVDKLDKYRDLCMRVREHKAPRLADVLLFLVNERYIEFGT